jgi:serine/threonine-protein kinase RsbW
VTGASLETTTNAATVRIVNGPLVAPVLSRVVGMLAARAQCPVDRLDDALLVADAIAAHTQAHTADGHVTVRLAAGPDGIEMQVGELGKGGADGLVADASLPGVGNILERIADSVEIERAAGRESITVRLGFGR